MSSTDEIQEKIERTVEYATKVADKVWFQDEGIDLPGGFLSYQHAMIATIMAAIAVPTLWHFFRSVIVFTWIEDHEIVDGKGGKSPSRSPTRKKSPSPMKKTSSMKSSMKAVPMKKGKSPSGRSKTPMKAMKRG